MKNKSIPEIYLQEYKLQQPLKSSSMYEKSLATQKWGPLPQQLTQQIVLTVRNINN